MHTTFQSTTLWDYAFAEGIFDELYTQTGELRPHWSGMIQKLKTLGPKEIQQRWQETRRLLRDNGVTYNAYGDGLDRPWELDLIPLVIAADEWQFIEQGLLQRAQLLNLVLTDLYGPQKLLKDNILPPEVIYAHPGFLRACFGIEPPAHNPLLSLYAADLARDTQGQWYIIGDRSQAPPGAGYALENRIIISRVLPDLFREAQVRRLALFFRTLRNTLMHMSWRKSEEVRIVMLSAGPDSETYFEQAYLAMYLGYTLVQGADLTVREGRVWLKTLDGLQPIDVILRYLNDSDCDPLELRQDAYMGIPGLLQAARLKNVAIVNPIGVGILENPALMAFLPAIAHYFLGEDLTLPSARTWWCGQQMDRDYVLAHLTELVIKKTLHTAGYEFIRPAELTTSEQAQLRQQILAQPYMFIGQEEMSRSTLAVFTPEQLTAQQIVLRSFVVASEGSYMAMPGGLTRVVSSSDTPLSSSYSGGISKDTWILASGPEQPLSLLPFMGQNPVLVNGQGELPSRVAENLFWLGRYAERAESVIRLLRTLLLQMLEPVDSADIQNRICLHTLLRALTHLTKTYPGFVGTGAEERLQNPTSELLSIFLDKARPGGLSFTLNALLYAARSVRDRISPDIWRVFNELEEGLQILQVQRKVQIKQEEIQSDTLDSDTLNAALEELNHLLVTFAAFTGFIMESMTYGQGWRFLMIGRRLERAQQMIPLLRTLLSTSSVHEAILLESLLAICDSLMTYRRRYRTQVQPQETLALLLLDESNPRSLAHQFEQLQIYIHQLPRIEHIFAHKSQEQRLVLEGLTRLRLSHIEELVHTESPNHFRTQLDQILVRLSHLLPELSDAITHSYFSHTEPSQQLVRFNRNTAF